MGNGCKFMLCYQPVIFIILSNLSYLVLESQSHSISHHTYQSTQLSRLCLDYVYAKVRIISLIMKLSKFLLPRFPYYASVLYKCHVDFISLVTRVSISIQKPYNVIIFLLSLFSTYHYLFYTLYASAFVYGLYYVQAYLDAYYQFKPDFIIRLLLFNNICTIKLNCNIDICGELLHYTNRADVTLCGSWFAGHMHPFFISIWVVFEVSHDQIKLKKLPVPNQNYF